MPSEREGEGERERGRWRDTYFLQETVRLSFIPTKNRRQKPKEPAHPVRETGDERVPTDRWREAEREREGGKASDGAAGWMAVIPLL